MEAKESQEELKRRALCSGHGGKETNGPSKGKSKRQDATSGTECGGSAADRSFAEGVVSTLFHAIVVCYYLLVLFAELEALKPRPEAIRLMGGTTFGGRWKFLTCINLVRGCAGELEPVGLRQLVLRGASGCDSLTTRGSG